jgi:hypothetical protein
LRAGESIDRCTIVLTRFDPGPTAAEEKEDFTMDIKEEDSSIVVKLKTVGDSRRHPSWKRSTTAVGFLASFVLITANA